MCRYCLAFGFLLLALPLGAQKYRYLQYNTRDGLPSEQVRDAIVGPYGLLWVATDGGLARFDGEHFTSYNAALDSYYIKALAKDPKGRIVLLNDSGLYRLHHRDAKGAVHPDTAFVELVCPALPFSSDTALHYPGSLFIDRKGRYWMGQPDGRIARYTKRGLKLLTVSPPASQKGAAPRFAFAEDGNGQLFAATSAGKLYAFREELNAFRRIPTPSALGPIHCLYSEEEQIIAGGRGLWSFQYEAGQLTGSSYAPLNGLVIQCIAADGQQRLLLGSRDQGLFSALGRGKAWEVRTVYGANDPHRVEALPFRSIHRIRRDSAGNIWLGSAEGLGLLQSRFFETVFGLANNNTLATRALPDGRVLLSYGDVYAIQPQGDRFSIKKLPDSGQGFITGMAFCDPKLWLSTAKGELMDYENGQLRLRHDLSDRGGGIFFMESSSDGSLWFCQAPNDNPILGIARLRANGQLRFYERESGLESRILIVRESSRQRLYAAGIGAETYLYRYLPEEDVFINLSLPLPFAHSRGFEVHDMAIDQQGIVWLATTDGLLRYDLERIRRVEMGPYTQAEIRSVLALSPGELWLSTSTEGLLYYSNAERTYTQFGQDSGLPSSVGAYRCLSQSLNGRLWVGTAEGIVYSRDPRPRPLPTTAPLLMAPQQAAAEAGSELRKRPGTPLQLEWALPAFPSQGAVYRYRLKHSTDSSWVDLGTDNSLTLSGLPADHYEWQLQARRPGGYSWSPPLSFGLVVQPPWHKRWWAKVLLATAGLYLLYFLSRQVIGRLRRRIKVLEERLQLRERTIARQTKVLQEQSANLVQQRSDLEAISHAKPDDQPHALPHTFLHQLMMKIQPGAPWEEVLPLFQAALEQQSGCDQWNIGWYEAEQLYSICIESGSERMRLASEPFDEKNSLPVWVLVHQSSLLLNRQKEEYASIVGSDASLDWGSALMVRAEIAGKQPLVLSFLAKRREAFAPADQQVAEMLARHLSLNLRIPITPNYRTA